MTWIAAWLATGVLILVVIGGAHLSNGRSRRSEWAASVAASCKACRLRHSVCWTELACRP
jgi:hypothetical protein